MIHTKKGIIYQKVNFLAFRAELAGMLDISQTQFGNPFMFASVTWEQGISEFP